MQQNEDLNIEVQTDLRLELQFLFFFLLDLIILGIKYNPASITAIIIPKIELSADFVESICKSGLINDFSSTSSINIIFKSSSFIITEQESGKNNKRIGLDAAINLCTKNGYTLLFTKLDRLSREVEFLFTLRNKGVKLRCIELPELNTLTLGIFGTVAQYERELISSRTKRSLAELKKIKKLGTPKNLTVAARKKGVAVIMQAY